MAGLNLKLITPVGSLAIDTLYAPSETLERKLLKLRYRAPKRMLSPTHPSRISHWHKKQEHRGIDLQSPGTYQLILSNLRHMREHSIPMF